MANKRSQQPNDAQLERERLNSLINSMADAVIAVDEKMNIVLFNAATLNILDVNDSMTGKNIDSLTNFVDADGQNINLRKIIMSAKTYYYSRDWRLKYSDNSTVNLYVSISPVRLGYKQEGMRGFVMLLRDITREKSLEEERDEFISVVSHELRTPIAIAEGNIGNAQYILEKSGDTKKASQALAQAHDQVTFLSGMINDLSTLSRAERGKLALDIEEFNVAQLVSELQNLYLPDAEGKGLALSTIVDPKLELLKSSKLYVKEILQNFITNAIKYTDTGSVKISARPKDNGVQFDIADTGIGISRADQDKLYDKFFRSEDYRTRQHNGTGLGLYVTMKLARLIHADISLESEVNKGSVFSIVIPNIQPVANS